MGCNGDTTSHVTDNQVQILILLSDTCCITARNGSLIQGMPDTDAFHQRRTRDTGIVVEFIHYTRISNEGSTIIYLLSNLISNQTTQVTSMIMHRDTTQRITHHQGVDLIDTTLQGFHQSASSDDSIEVDGDISPLKFIDHQLATKVLLFQHILKGCQFFCRVIDRTQQDRFLILEDSHLRGGGTRIDHKNHHMAARAKE